MGFSSTQLGHEENGMPIDGHLTLKNIKKNIGPDRPIAVQVQNACKTYGRGPPVLNDLNMTVPRGTIYGLLGSSGCGKTTILSCIVGLRKLDAGDIWVYGARPGTKDSGIPGKTIGYMPQDIALYQKMKIDEILYYFGGIYGMSTSEISARIEFLMSFLDLPEPGSRRIDSLSGGQQRRVSLCVSLIHTPALLILDEPTVGVDPLIRESIWEYLTDLVSRRRTTVIITTHYIEESSKSDTVGLMRGGRLLVEKPPSDLLEEHKANLLEEIVLKLCKKEGPSDEVSDAIQEMSFYSKKKRFSHNKNTKANTVVGLKFKSKAPEDDMYQRNRSQSASRRRQSVIEAVNDTFARQSDKVFSLVKRNFLTLFRNPLFVVGLLILPTFQTVLFNYIVGREPINERMGVVNGDFENRSFAGFCAQREPGCLSPGLSCDYLGRFGNKILWDEFETKDAALAYVKGGAVRGYMEIPDNFTLHMQNRILYKNNADNESLDGSTIKLRMDNADYLMNVFLVNNIYNNYLSFAKAMVRDCGGDPRVVELPLKYNAIYGAINSGTAEYMQPVQILLIMFLLPMTVAVTYIWDKKAGTLDRTMVAGVDFFHVIVSLLISEGLIMILELFLCLMVLIVVFNFEIQGSIFLFFLLALLTGISGLSFGFLFGVMCDHEIEVLVWALFVYLPVLVSSGGTWPRNGMDPTAKFITDFFPITMPAESSRSIVSRGQDLFHNNVWPGFLVLCTWISLCVCLSGIIHRIRK
ncbi:ABC transporter G family member 23 isoform X2 [Folsomia candida]|uniref:ABC transporter G family member 23 isoform X2 n=1 Tax=Folsomia candida TaxID=158441 RepID=UPI000B8FBAF9|nr:ABC transporter G family member 23 isoform X2 [Folsomia candida]